MSLHGIGGAVDVEQFVTERDRPAVVGERHRKCPPEPAVDVVDAVVLPGMMHDISRQ
jgi:hypothetical protein